MIDTKQCKGCLYRSEFGYCIKSYVSGKSRTVINRKTVVFSKDHVCEDWTPLNKRSIVPFDGGIRKRIDIELSNRERMMRVSRNGHVYIQDNPEVERLYTAGASDFEIADAIGVSKHSVKNWRHRNGLPSNQKTGRPKKEEHHESGTENQGEV